AVTGGRGGGRRLRVTDHLGVGAGVLRCAVLRGPRGVLFGGRGGVGRRVLLGCRGRVGRRGAISGTVEREQHRSFRDAVAHRHGQLLDHTRERGGHVHGGLV